MNIELLVDMGFDAPAFAALSPNDLVIAIDAVDDKVLEQATAEALKALTRKKAAAAGSGVGRVGSMDAGLRLVPEAPGKRANRSGPGCT